MKLRIGHLDFIVRPFRESDEEYGVQWGLMDPLAQEILLDDDLSAHRQLETLLHEIMHAIWDTYNLPDSIAEEHACSALGAALAAVIRSNKGLLPVLTALRDGAGFLGD